MIAAGLTVQRSRALFECHSCAARPDEARFPPTFKRGKPRLCLDCIGSAGREQEMRERLFVRLAQKASRRRKRNPEWRTATVVVRRTQYRARLRRREQDPQLDMIDILLVKP